MLKINELARLYLGIQGENGVRSITVDVSAWINLYPNGSVTVWHKRCGDSTPSPTGAVYDSEEQTVTWDITSVDTFVAGIGEAEFRLIENDVIKKTAKVMTGVSPAVTLAGTELGSDWASYINAVDSLRAGAVVAQEAAEDAQEAAEDAQGAAEDAQEAAEGAQTAAETAQGKAEDAQTAAEAAAARAEHASKVMVPAGGNEGQRLAKKSGTDFDMEWKTDPYYTKPEGGIPASDMAEGAIPDPEDLIDDTAGEGDTDKTWSADKLTSDVLSAIKESDKSGVDFDLSDEDGNVILRLEDGHIKTKEFDSSDTIKTGLTDSDSDLDMSDAQGNIIARFKDGHIQTQMFDSSDLMPSWNGKKWAVVGDSLTERNIKTTLHYYDYIAIPLKMTMYVCAYGGCGYGRSVQYGKYFWEMCAEIPNDTDVITIFGSVNDHNSEKEIGNPTDTGMTTLCGCMNTAIDYVEQHYPLIPLGIASPCPIQGREPTDTGEGAEWMKDYCDALEAVCALRGVPYLDLFHHSNMHPSNANFLALAYPEGDGTHPNEVGHKILAPKFFSLLKQLIL